MSHSFLVVSTLLAFLGSFGTYLIAPHRHMGKIRSASLMNLLVLGTFYILNSPEDPLMHSLFLGATFVGMNDPQKINKKNLFVITILYLILFFTINFRVNFLGGSLGLMAFIASTLIYALTSRGIPKFNKAFFDK